MLFWPLSQMRDSLQMGRGGQRNEQFFIHAMTPNEITKKVINKFPCEQLLHRDCDSFQDTRQVYSESREARI